MHIVHAPHTTTSHDERGMASIMITMVIMTVIALVVVGFAVVSRREQRLTLDRQLNTQAFYAAESGVNDTYKLIAGSLASADTIDLVKTSCANTGIYAPLGASSNLSPGVSYNCVLVDPAPLKFEKKDITDSNAWIIPVYTDKNPDTMVINWKPRAATGNARVECPAVTRYTNLDTSSRDCQYPVLRVDVADAQAFNGTDGKMMNDKLSTYYFHPYANGSTVSWAALNHRSATISDNDANSPQVVVVSSCDNSTTSYGSCTVEIRNAGPGLRFSTKTYVRITSLYGASDASIITKQGAEQLKMYGGQVMLDVTGKAQDVLRRVQVRIPADQTGNAFTPAFGVQGTGSICKRYQTYHNPSGGYFGNASDIPISLFGGANPDRMCEQSAATGSLIAGTGFPVVGINCGGPCPANPASYNPFPSDKYLYEVGYENQTTVPAGLTITSCRWNFGDGKTETINCNPGDKMRHNYALAGDTGEYTNRVSCAMVGTDNICTPTGAFSHFQAGCPNQSERNLVRRDYNTTITAFFSNGTSKTSDPVLVRFPLCG